MSSEVTTVAQASAVAATLGVSLETLLKVLVPRLGD